MTSPLFAMPADLYNPPDALEVFLEAFEGPLDLLLYLIRKQNINVLDIIYFRLFTVRFVFTYIGKVKSSYRRKIYRLFFYRVAA